MKKIFREMHPQPGILRSFADNELRGEALDKVSSHLEDCETCQEKLNIMQERSEAMERHFTPEGLHVTPASLARRRIDRYIHQQEVSQMSKLHISGPMRRVAIAISVIAVLAIAFSFPEVRAIANQFLGLFRVEHVTVFDANLNDLSSQLGRSPQLEAFFNDQVKTEVTGKSTDFATPDGASAALGMPVRLPDVNEEFPKLTSQPAAKLTFTIDLERARAILKEIGREDIQLPDSADGQTVEINIPSSLEAKYGNCAAEAVKPSDPDMPEGQTPFACTKLIQIPSPTISAPPGMDVAKIGEAYLELMGMTPEQAQAFSANIDWTNTLVLPIPMQATDYQEVNVDGVTGQLIMVERGNTNPMYALIWVKDGMVYMLAGPGDARTAVSIANSMK